MTMPPTHKVTHSELESFLQNPLQIVGLQFILDPEDDDGTFYEVVELRFLKGGERRFVVQYGDFEMVDDMEEEEFVMMLKDSVLLENVQVEGQQ
jgi:hypothetical protein